MSIHVVAVRLSIILLLSVIGVACQDQSALAPEATPEPEALNEHDLLMAKELSDFMMDFGEVSEEEKAVYGNRAGFFEWTAARPTPRVPDRDWRSVLNDSLADAEPLWSQGYEELIIRDFFRDRRGGFFLDVGCFRPKNNSTTYYLERMLGWTGIGIDAMEKYAEPWAEHRPNSVFVANAVSDKDGEVLTFHVGNVVNSLDANIVKSLGGERETIEVTTMNTRHDS